MPEDPLNVLANMNNKQSMADGGVVPPQYKEADDLIRKYLEENPQYIYGEGGQVSPEVETAPLPWDKYSEQPQAGMGATEVPTSDQSIFTKPPITSETPPVETPPVAEAPVQITPPPATTPTVQTPPTDTPSTTCLLYTSPSPRDRQKSRMPSSA